MQELRNNENKSKEGKLVSSIKKVLLYIMSSRSLQYLTGVHNSKDTQYKENFHIVCYTAGRNDEYRAKISMQK